MRLSPVSGFIIDVETSLPYVIDMSDDGDYACMFAIGLELLHHGLDLRTRTNDHLVHQVHDQRSLRDIAINFIFI